MFTRHKPETAQNTVLDLGQMDHDGRPYTVEGTFHPNAPNELASVRFGYGTVFYSEITAADMGDMSPLEKEAFEYATTKVATLQETGAS